MTRVPVLEVGGTHATAMYVETSNWTAQPDPRSRVSLRGDAPADELLDTLAGCVRSIGPVTGATLVVAIPGPFDYAGGIGRFRDVGKFDALYGVDVGAGLTARLSPAPRRLVFVNDAAAFALGEWLVGAAVRARRAVAITLGTGIGSAFVADGAVVSSGPTVPRDGHVYRLSVDDRPLESVVSTRAIQDRYGDSRVEVREIAERAGRGDQRALAAFTEPLVALGMALAPWLSAFGTQTLIVGGAMSESWSLVAPALRTGLAAGDPPVDVPIRKSADPQRATAIGAAWHALGEVPARVGCK